MSGGWWRSICENRRSNDQEFGIWTLTRRVEDDATASPCQGEAKEVDTGILHFALE